jgi:hypothetical protein
LRWARARRRRLSLVGGVAIFGRNALTAPSPMELCQTVVEGRRRTERGPAEGRGRSDNECEERDREIAEARERAGGSGDGCRFRPVATRF